MGKAGCGQQAPPTQPSGVAANTGVSLLVGGKLDHLWKFLFAAKSGHGQGEPVESAGFEGN